MARILNRLNARKVAALTEHGRHADGGGLYLSISPNGGRRWVFMYRWRGKQTELGLGSARTVSLAKARMLASECRDQLADGINPMSSRSPSGGSTFGEVADGVIEAKRPSWRSSKHAGQWTMTLGNHAGALRNLPVSDVTTEDVLAVLKPLWGTCRETASRMRSRIERVLDAAKAQGLRHGENPARWRGHLDQLLPGKQKLERRHHAAMPYADVPAFVERLRAVDGVTARALEFCILTASRTKEVLGARRCEFDLDAALWTVPPPRMKGGREHKVPLSPRAIEIVRQMPEGEFVFPGRFEGTRLTDSMLLHMLQDRMKVAGFTVHGFRSSFRDWAGDCTPHPRDVVEAALAHAIENAVEAAYRRGTAIEKRRKLMEDWARFCGGLEQKL